MAHTLHHPESAFHRHTSALRDSIDWSAAAWAGVIAGVVFMMAQMLLVWLLQGQSPWGPPRLIAAMLLGRDVLPPPADFALVPMMAAMGLHLVASVLYGIVIAWLVHRLSMAGATVAGVVFGLVAMYLVNFYLIAPAVFPWFVQARSWITALTHAMFGAAAAASYIGLRKPEQEVSRERA